MNIPKTYLTENVDKNAILKILTQGNPSGTNNPQYMQLADWAGRRQSKIKNIELSRLKISDSSLIGKQLNNRYNTLGSLLNTLKNLTDSQGDNAEIAKLAQQITLEILEDLKAKDEGNVQPKEEANLYEGMDWSAEKARRLTAARESGEAISEVLDKFYDDYYRIEYAGSADEGIVTKLKSLDKILIPEFNALGYNPEVNPLAQFLKLLIKYKKDKIFDKLTFNTYGAIHNSFISKAITGNELGNYPADINTENILFCNDLYNRNGLDMVEYLLLQKQFINAAKGTIYENDLKFIAKVFVQQRTFDKNYEQNIKLLFKKGTQATSTLADAAKLKSILEVRELYSHLFKTAAKKRVNVDEIVDRAENIVLDMIQHILDQGEFERAYSAEVKDTEARLAKIGYRRNEANIKTSKKILSEYELDANAEYQILAKLIAMHNKSAEAKKAGADK